MGVGPIEVSVTQTLTRGLNLTRRFNLTRGLDKTVSILVLASCHRTAKNCGAVGHPHFVVRHSIVFSGSAASLLKPRADMALMTVADNNH